MTPDHAEGDGRSGKQAREVGSHFSGPSAGRTLPGVPTGRRLPGRVPGSEKRRFLGEVPALSVRLLLSWC